MIKNNMQICKQNKYNLVFVQKKLWTSHSSEAVHMLLDLFPASL